MAVAAVVVGLVLVVAPGEALLLTLLALAAVAAGVVALWRFEWFLLITLAVRTSLDLFVVSDGMGFGAMLAAVFLLASTVWLLVQWRMGRWVPLSIASKALLGLAAASFASVPGSLLRGASLQGALEISAGVVMFPVLEQLLAGRPDRAKRLVVAVLISTIVPVATGLLQWSGDQGQQLFGDVGRIRGSFVHPNPFATYLVSVMLLTIGLSLVTRGRRRVGLLVLSGLLGLLIVVTYTRAGWIGLIVGLVYLGIRWNRWILAGMVVAAAGIVVFVPSVMARIGELEEDPYLPPHVPDSSLAWRVGYWEELLPRVVESPVTGIGVRTVVNLSEEELEPHNIYVQAVVEMGILGLGTLLASVIAVGLTLQRRARAAAGPVERAIAVVAMAAALALFSQTLSENLLNQTMAYWYLAAVSLWGYHSSRAPSTPTELR